MRFQLLPCLALFAHTVLADVKVSSPAGGTTVPAGSPFVVTFIDAQVAPALSLFSTFSLDLVQGGQSMGTSQVRGRTVPQREDEWKYGYMGVWWREYNPKKIRNPTC